MDNLDTTNVILAIMAATAVVQLALMIAILVWAGRQFARLKHEITQLKAHTEGLSGVFKAISTHADGVVADLRMVAARADGVGRELEKVGVLLQDMVKVIGVEVHRATNGVRVAMDLIEALYHGASSIGDTLKSGLKHVVENRFRHGDSPEGAPDDPFRTAGDPFQKPGDPFQKPADPFQKI